MTQDTYTDSQGREWYRGEYADWPRYPEEIPISVYNYVREETIDWVKNLPWWRRLFNKFDV